MRHFPQLRKVEIATAVETPGYNTLNIAGVLPGTGALADEWVVVGGHYDHIGHGYTGSRAPGDDRVHPGADDNASGVGTILILVDRLAEAAAEDGTVEMMVNPVFGPSVGAAAAPQPNAYTNNGVYGVFFDGPSTPLQTPAPPSAAAVAE